MEKNLTFILFVKHEITELTPAIQAPKQGKVKRQGKTDEEDI